MAIDIVGRDACGEGGGIGADILREFEPGCRYESPLVAIERPVILIEAALSCGTLRGYRGTTGVRMDGGDWEMAIQHSKLPRVISKHGIEGVVESGTIGALKVRERHNCHGSVGGSELMPGAGDLPPIVHACWCGRSVVMRGEPTEFTASHK